MRNFIVVDIGGTLIKYGVLTERGTFLEKSEILTEAQLGGPIVLNKVKKIGDELKEKYAVSGVCISTAGQVHSKRGEILYASSLIPDYTGMKIKKDLEAHFQLPVEVENDVNCVGLAESWLGKGKNSKSLFCLTVGTGIGGSYIVDNKLQTGHSYSGGEIGYIPIEGSQFQELASTRILIENVAKRKGVSEQDINGKIIFEKAREGDVICIEEIDRLVYYLSKGIATIAYMMNPETIIIGGGITNQKDYLFPLIKEQLNKDIIPAILNQTNIEIAGNLNNAGMIGALRHFLLQESMQPFNKITTMIESNKHKLTNGESMIANYIIKNMSDVPNHTISEMAYKINVSESMITRFCKKLDIGSYSKLRLMTKEEITGTRLHDKGDMKELVEVKQDYISILNKLETLNYSLDLSEIVKNTKTPKQIVLYGIAEMSYIVRLIKYKLMQVGISIDIFTNSYEMEASSYILQPEAIAIGLSPSGADNDINSMLNIAKQKGCTTIGITSQRGSLTTNLSDSVILLPSTENLTNNTSTYSEVTILFLLELLLKQLSSKSERNIV